MTLSQRLRATLLILVVAAMAGSAPAMAATIPDAAGDATDGDAGHDITQFDWSYDPGAGTAVGTITLAGAGTGADGALLAVFGTAGPDGSCSSTDGALLFGVKSIPNAAQWTPISGGQTGDFHSAQLSSSGQTYTVTASDAQLAGKPFTCAEAEVTDASNTDVVFDTATGAGAAATPTPAPSAPAAPTPAPARAAKLRATLSGVPATVKRGQRFRPTLTIANRGTATSKAITVTFKRVHGVSVSPRSLKVKGLAPGKAKRIALRVSLSRTLPSTAPLVATAKSGSLHATAKKTLKRKAKPKPAPKPRKGGLPGTFWWWNEFTSYTPFNVFSLRFYDNGYAYYRLPDDGQSVPAKCTKVTSVPDKDGDYGPGCVKWTLKGSTLTFTDPRFTGTYKDGKLSIRDKDDTFKVDKLAEPKAGKRFNFSYRNIDSTGICAPFSYCSIRKSYLTLQADGQFGLQEESSSSLDTGGSFTYAGSYPPESRGTYEVLSGYRIRLSYADGKTETVPFGIVDGTSSVDSNVKVVVGRLPYWVPDEND